MKIALFTRKSAVTKESMHITLSLYAHMLAQHHDVLTVPGVGVIDHVRAFWKKKMDVDIIHTFSAAPLMALKGILSRKKGVKVVHTLKSTSRHPLGQHFFRLLNYVDAVTVPTHVMKEKLVSRGVYASKVHVIPSFIDTQRFVPLNKAALKKKYGFLGNVVLYYGSLFPSKGVETLVQAIPDSDESTIIKSTTFIFALRDNPSEEFLASVRGKPIRIITDDIDVVEYVNLANVVVLPYKDLVATEGNPSCLIEAIACKTPVVTSDLPELREIFSDDEVVFVKPNDVDALREAISRVLEDGALRVRLVEYAFPKVKQFDVRVVQKQFEELYRELSD
jgi:glycosyltransferase involved in cell wall biosynthesis